MVEKRKSARVPVSIQIESEVPYEKLIFGYARDISATGISICSEVVSSFDAIPKIGEVLTLSFKLPRTDTKVKVMARLVRVDMYEGRLPILGLSYTNLEKSSKETIDHYVQHTQMALFEKTNPSAVVS